jgi:dephospho-CoA kinase
MVNQEDIHEPVWRRSNYIMGKSMEKTIVLVGPIASGKGTVAKMLARMGYAHFEYGDEVRKELALRGLPITREILQDVSDSLRLEFGTDILAQRIATSVGSLRSQGKATKAVIDGLRHPDEVQWLKKQLQAYVIGITIPSELRFQRLRVRGRSSDPKTSEDFAIAEQRDRGVGQPYYGNSVDECLPLANVIIANTGSREDLKRKLQETLIALEIGRR